MICIIPYQTDHNNGMELLYSIRSLVKHFISLKNILLVGDLPTWYKGDHFPLRDIPIRREYSMYVKVMTGAKKAGVTEFLYTTDDHFALKDFDESLPNYYTGTCKQSALNHSSGRYRRLYQNCPEGWLNYDNHMPIVMKVFNWESRRLETDTPIKSTYANQAQVKGVPINDCKFFNGHSYEQIKEIIKDKPFFSTSPFSQNIDMIKIFKELYPEKSVYEQ